MLSLHFMFCPSACMYSCSTRTVDTVNHARQAGIPDVTCVICLPSNSQIRHAHAREAQAQYSGHDVDISITDSFRARERAEKVSIACVRSNLLRHSTSDLDSNIYAVYGVLRLADLDWARGGQTLNWLLGYLGGYGGTLGDRDIGTARSTSSRSITRRQMCGWQRGMGLQRSRGTRSAVYPTEHK